MTTDLTRPIDTDRLRAVRDLLQSRLVERDVPVRLALLAALAGEHLLLLGPPGTAKSMVASRLHLAMSEGEYFERLLTRFTVPEELFGPLSIKALENDRYLRQTTGYLPAATIAFLDEVFKANSAILNSMLTLLNERKFDNGTQREDTPLVAVVAASNELPEGEELAALLDRFLLRVHVGPVSRDGFGALLDASTGEVPVLADALRLTSDDLDAVRAASARVTLPPDVRAMLADLRDWCAAEGLAVSDRRWRQIAKLLKTSAATNGRDAVSLWDGWLLRHCVGLPGDAGKVADWFAQRVAASGEIEPGRLLPLLVAMERRLAHDSGGRSQKRDAKGRLVFRRADGREVSASAKPRQAMRGGERLYLAPAQSLVHTHLGTRPISDRSNGGLGYTRSELAPIVLSLPERHVAFGNWASRENYLDEAANQLVEDVSKSPVMVPTPYTRAHIGAQVAEVVAIEARVGQYAQRLQQHRDSLERDIRSHLWVTDDFLPVAQSSLAKSAQVLAELGARVKALREATAALPVAAEIDLTSDDVDDDLVPEEAADS